MLQEVILADYVLRPARQDDSQTIKKLIREVGINPMSLNWKRFIVAETEDGRFAGCGQLKPHSDGTIELASIAVFPWARNQGLASNIIQKLISKAPRPLYLTCRSPLGVFYQKFGFRIASGNDLPRYFKRVSQFAGLAKALNIMNETLLVMVLD